MLVSSTTLSRDNYNYRLRARFPPLSIINNSDELPVQLRLPQALRDATNRKQLSSLSLLGQVFWRYSMTRNGHHHHNTDPNNGSTMVAVTTSPVNNAQLVNGATTATSPGAVSVPTDSAIDVMLTSPMSPSETTFNSSANGGFAGGTDIQITQCNNTTMSKNNNNSNNHQSVNGAAAAVPRRKATAAGSNNNNNNVQTIDLLSPTLANSFGTFCQIDTPSDTMSSISSFCSAVQSPTGSFPRGTEPKAQHNRHRMSLDLDRVFSNNSTNVNNNDMALTTPTTATGNNGNAISRSAEYQRSSIRTRPTPPNTLNLICFEDANNLNPSATRLPAAFHSTLSVFGNAKATAPLASIDCDTPMTCASSTASTISSFGNSSQSRGAFISPDAAPQTSTFGRIPGHHHKRNNKSSQSHRPPKHYQESDILEYCRSPLADKISDYEELPSRGTPSTTTTSDGKIYQSTLSHGPLMSSFRSTRSNETASAPHTNDSSKLQRPDLLHEIRTITSLNDNILMPAGTSFSSSASSASTASSAASASSSADADAKRSSPTAASPPPPQQPAPILQLPLCSSQMVFVNPVNVTEAPAQLNCDSSKENSPFYAEPAYSLAVPQPQQQHQQQRVTAAGAAQLRTAPPLPLITKTLATPLPSPLDAEHQPFHALLPPPQKGRPSNGAPRTTGLIIGHDAWSLDSSWMFMNTDDDENTDHNNGDDDNTATDADNDGDPARSIAATAADANDIDYDTDEHWRTAYSGHHTAGSRPYPSSTAETAAKCSTIHRSTSALGGGTLTRSSTKAQPTVQQLILTRMPELSAKLTNGGARMLGLFGPNARQAYCVDSSAALAQCFRMSSYDNVTDRSGHAGYKNSILQLARSAASSSVHSDDGTVFSEPWDSSQWDTLSLNQCGEWRGGECRRMYKIYRGVMIYDVTAHKSAKGDFAAAGV